MCCWTWARLSPFPEDATANALGREEFARRRTVTIADQPMTIVAPEDLILSKLDWAKDSHSQMQLGDVRNLFRSVRDLDTHYLRRWADRLGLATLYHEVCP